jgi:cell division protein ZapE
VRLLECPDESIHGYAHPLSLRSSATNGYLNVTLQTHYQRALDQHGFTSDPAQQEAVKLLAGVYTELCQPRHSGIRAALRKTPVIGELFSPPAPPKGAYMWGGVGRGKTFIMDMFFEALPFDDKLRYHFHRLMYRVHGRLRELSGQTDPIEIVAAELAAQARVICFDEFFVSEIGDAMVLGKLLKGLFRRGVCLITTSNIPPEHLYKDGLQRQQFMPAIKLLEKHTMSLNVDHGNDYRLRVLEQAEIWHSPLDTVAEENLERYFTAIAPDTGTIGQPIEVLGRDIHTRRRADGIGWFDFAELCDGPRSQNDYIEIARAFQTVLLANVPLLTSETDNQARRFIALVDEFYDRRVKLIVSATSPIADIYSGQRLSMEFQRTASRLLEMQSKNYLSLPHIP